jgi:cysteine desulfurase/selenocysteine lyase
MGALNACWQKFRESMPVARRWAYFDHAAVAPLSGPGRDAVLAWTDQATDEGDPVWPLWERRVEEVRDLVARLIGADRREVAFVPNTTAGISLVAEGFPWQAGDNLVVPANEFPSNLYPWMNLERRGVQTRRLPVPGAGLDIDQVLAACDDRTRLIAISWVGYATGWRLDVGALVEAAHRRGILVFLDAIQGLGVFPLDVGDTGVDFLAADGHKWMLGPEGAGIFYLRREHLERLRPLNVGWHSVVRSHDFNRCELDLRPEAARYEGGSQNMVGTLALGASLSLLADLGLSSKTSPLADRVLEINALAAERLERSGARIASDLAAGRASGILSFELPGRDLAAARRRCLDAGVVLSVRVGRLRISPHAYVNEDDVDRLLDALPPGRST